MFYLFYLLNYGALVPSRLLLFFTIAYPNMNAAGITRLIP